MKKIVSFFAIVSFLLTFTSVFGIVQWHPAGEIGPGTFGENVSIGDYTFPQNVLVEGHISAPIFYDSNNAAYYVNPNSASNIYSLTTVSSVSIGGNLNMNNHQINNVANPSSSSDALNLGYADDRYVNVAGDTMTGDLNMNGHNINGVNTLTASSFVDRDNSNYYVNPNGASKIDTLTTVGATSIGGNLDMNSHQINNVANPSSSSDVLNLGYADSRYVNVAGDTMTGVLNMNGNDISGVNQLTASKIVDSDNSNYYLDPSSTSKVDKMWVTGDLLVQGKISNVNVENLNTNGSLIPTFDNKFDLGNSTNRWQNGYFSGSVSANSISGTTITESGTQVLNNIVAGNGLTSSRSGASETLNVGAGTGISVGSDSVSVVYGSTSGTAAEGNNQITVSAGSGLTGGGTITIGSGGTVTISHADTSSQASVDNSGTNVIQSIDLDTYGHVTKISSVNLSNDFLTESAADNRYLKLSGGTMSGNIDMNTNSITNLANPSSSGDALNLGYADSRYVNVAGDKMAGDLNMTNNSITDVKYLSADTVGANQVHAGEGEFLYGDAKLYASNLYVTNLYSLQSSTATINVGADLDMYGDTITGLRTPRASSDAATKGYVDDKIYTVTECLNGTDIVMIGCSCAQGDTYLMGSCTIQAHPNPATGRDFAVGDDNVWGCDLKTNEVTSGYGETQTYIGQFINQHCAEGTPLPQINRALYGRECWGANAGYWDLANEPRDYSVCARCVCEKS